MKTTIIQGNQPLLLRDPDQLQLVKSGAIAVFAVRVAQDVPIGPRHYLFSVQPGEALFGIKVACTDSHLGLLAVALEPTELWTQPLQSLALAELHACVDRWIVQLGQIEHLPKPSGNSLIPSPDRFIALTQNQIFHPPKHQICWAKVQQGSAHWFGQPTLTFSDTDGFCPLSTGIWLSTNQAIELALCPTSDMALSGVVQGLESLHLRLFQLLEHLETEAIQTEQVRFQQRQQLNRQVTHTTLGGLMALLQPPAGNQIAGQDELLMVAGAVGRALKVQIKPALSSENTARMNTPLEAIARASRLRLRRVTLRGNWWEKDGEPIVAYTLNDHRPVALLPVAGDHYEIFAPVWSDRAAPGTQKQQRVNAAIAAQLDTTAYIFYRPLPDSIMSAWDLAKFAFQGQGKNLLLLFGMGIAGTLAGMLVPLATGILVDRALPMGDQRLLSEIGLGLFLTTFAIVGTELVQSLASLRLETTSEVTMQAAVWDRLLKLQPAFFRNYSVGDLQSRVTGVSQIRRRLTGTTLRTILTSFFALLNFGLMLSYSPALALVAAAVAVVVMGFTIASGALLLRNNRTLLELRGEIFGLLVRLIEAVPKLRSAGAETRAFATWGNKYRQQLQLTLNTQYLEDSVRIFNTIMPTVTAALIFWTAVAQIQRAQSYNQDVLSTGTFLAFSAAFGIFITGATNLSNAAISVLEVVTLWQRSQPILTAEPEVDAAKADPGRLIGRVNVDHVTFRYREDGPLTLDQVTITVEPGEFVALVGPSGSGKSTLLRLLLGFDMPLEGSIYYDGQDLSGLDVLAVRRQLGVVLQNSRINSGSIFEIISANTPISVTEAWEAAEMAGLADDIRAMPMGMYTFINEGGSNISGGQRQRLIIARALALKPQILLFDEATSALDNRTQAIVTESLDRLGVSRLVVAHRLSTIRNADRIYVMQAGRVIQQGSFDQLAQQDGLFAQLIARQLGDFQPSSHPVSSAS